MGRNRRCNYVILKWENGLGPTRICTGPGPTGIYTGMGPTVSYTGPGPTTF